MLLAPIDQHVRKMLPAAERLRSYYAGSDHSYFVSANGQIALMIRVIKKLMHKSY
jgi:hypothetical protein